MTHLAKLALASLFAIAILSGAASADANCDGPITGIGDAKHGANYDPPRKYDTEALARQRAIAGWSVKVRASCPGYSYRWIMASRKRVACEGVAGGLECAAMAHPYRRRFFR